MYFLGEINQAFWFSVLAQYLANCVFGKTAKVSSVNFLISKHDKVGFVYSSLGCYIILVRYVGTTFLKGAK